MHIPTISQLALSASTLFSTPNPDIPPNPSLSKPSPGYSPHTPSTITKSSFDFGQNFAVLNLDLINGLVAGVNGTKEGKKWVQCTGDWIDAVHKAKPQPLTIYTRIYFTTPWRPELPPHAPFASVVEPLGNVTESSPKSQVYGEFEPEGGDVVLRKGRYYAGDGNSLEEVLGGWGVDTVVLSGIRTSGVVLSTAFRLFDLNYKVYVISNNTIETSSHAQVINDVLLQGLFPKMPIEVISLEQAIGALKRSGKKRKGKGKKDD